MKRIQHVGDKYGHYDVGVEVEERDYNIPKHVIMPDLKVEPFTFGAVGDIYEDSANAPIMAKVLAAEDSFFLGLGDYTHADAQEGISKWGDILPTARFGCVGNHESCGGCSQAWMNFFGQNSWNSSLTYKGVTFISVNTETSDTSNLDPDASAAQSRGDWIILTLHRPIYTAAGSHTPDEGGIGNSTVPLVDKYNIAMVLQGHNHNYQRSFPMKDGTPTAAGNDYQLNQGTIWIVAGTGGDPNYPINDHPGFNAFELGETGGFVKVDVTANRLAGTFVDNSGDTKDTFSISR